VSKYCVKVQRESSPVERETSLVERETFPVQREGSPVSKYCMTAQREGAGGTPAPSAHETIRRCHLRQGAAGRRAADLAASSLLMPHSVVVLEQAPERGRAMHISERVGESTCNPVDQADSCRIDIHRWPSTATIATMARKKVPLDVEKEVLVRSRRRCAICFGLNRDTTIRQGQIAHLDGRNSNNDSENLVFLCFNHHDLLDSRTSQSKGFSLAEVREYRQELHVAISDAWRKPLTKGEATHTPAVWPEGQYVRETEGSEAQIHVRLVAPMRLHISGFAAWGTWRECPNIGELDFEAMLSGDQVTYTYDMPWAEPLFQYKATIRFRSDGLDLDEADDTHGMFGHNVSFKGIYRKASEGDT